MIWILDRGFDSIGFLRFLQQQGQLFVVRSAHPERLVQLDFGTRAILLEEALHQAPRLTTLQLEKAVFDQTTKRRNALLKVHVHGTAVHIPGSAPLICSAVRLEARTIQGSGWVLLSNLHLPEDDVAARAGLATRLVQVYRQHSGGVKLIH